MNISKIPIMTILLASLALTACSTMLTETQAGAEALKVTGKVNGGQADSLTGTSSRPFLFEGEILPTQAMLNDLWGGLIEAGVTFDNPRVREIKVVDGESYLVFAQTWEVETWFKNYVKTPAYLVFLDTAEQQLVILVDSNKKNPRRILGFGELRK